MSASSKAIEINSAGQSYRGGFQAKTYTAGGMALVLTDLGTDYAGSPLFTLSVHLDSKPGEDCIFIKDWSENREVANQLIKEGYFEPTGRTVPSGHVLVKEVRLTEKLKAALLTDQELSQELANLSSDGPEM